MPCHASHRYYIIVSSCLFIAHLGNGKFYIYSFSPFHTLSINISPKWNCEGAVEAVEEFNFTQILGFNKYWVFTRKSRRSLEYLSRWL